MPHSLVHILAQMMDHQQVKLGHLPATDSCSHQSVSRGTLNTDTLMRTSDISKHEAGTDNTLDISLLALEHLAQSAINICKGSENQASAGQELGMGLLEILFS